MARAGCLCAARVSETHPAWGETRSLVHRLSQHNSDNWAILTTTVSISVPLAPSFELVASFLRRLSSSRELTSRYLRKFRQSENPLVNTRASCRPYEPRA